MGAIDGNSVGGADGMETDSLDGSDTDCPAMQELSGMLYLLHPWYILIKALIVLAIAHYKVVKFPPHRGVSIQQLQTDYKAPEFIEALKHFLTSCAPQDKLVLPAESDMFNVFNHLHVSRGTSVVTRHGPGWQKIHAKPKIAACGRKAESPARFDTVFVWDEGHCLRFFGGHDSMYPVCLM